MQWMLNLMLARLVL